MSATGDYLKKFAETQLLRDRIMAALSQDTEALKAVVLAELTRLIDANPGLSLDEYADLIARQFVLPPSKTAHLKALLADGQRRMADAKREMIETGTGIPVDYDSTALRAAYAINFPRISQDINRQVQTALRSIIIRGGDIAELVSSLRHSQIGAHQAWTLAHTALAQYDNAYTIAISRQAGIQKYQYFGPSGQRPFCQSHVGNIYTSTEIAQMSNGQGLSVATSCGGYNCRHQWLPIPNQLNPKHMSGAL